MNNLASLRREYSLGRLRYADLKADPIAQFHDWFEQAAGVRQGANFRRWAIRLYKSCFSIDDRPAGEPNAATLATAAADGTPSARVILLKAVDDRGFIFYTNYESRKGQEIEANPRAAMVFYWSHQERQVCIAGSVTKLSREESAAYFQTRPRASRLAAWASLQSRPVESRAILERRWKEFDGAFAEGRVPMPDHWGGYVLSPVRMEFWQGRPGRFHDRFSYAKQLDAGWRLERLCP